MKNRIDVLDHGYVTLCNLSGPVRRFDREFDADDTDPANSARFSFDGANQGRKRVDDLKLANYLYKNKHTTPFEMIVVWLEMKMPIFCARQFVRHRTVSINEVSARYTKLPNEFYIPDPENVGIKSKSNKQGRTLKNNPAGRQFCHELKTVSNAAYSSYSTAISHGVPNEVARCFLPLNIYTKWLWKQDLHNMLHFLRLRMHDHAQYEARVYADAIYNILKKFLPHTIQVFDDSRSL